MSGTPDIVCVDTRVRALPATQRVLAHLRETLVEYISDLRYLKAPGDFSRTKRQWLLTRTEKQWYHRIEQKAGATELIADFVTNTPYDCSYAHHPVRMNKSPFLTIRVNLEEILSDMGNRCAKNPEKKFILRCGELGDSLALDHITHTAETLIPFFAFTPNAQLELWTRSNNINHLLSLPHHGSTTVVFSVTPNAIINREERGTPPMLERLMAARQLVEHGYRIIYAIEPIIQYEGWQHDYDNLIDQLFHHTPGDTLERVELSCFHYPKGLESKSMERFPESRIFYGELVPVNGCYRYFRPVRQDMYKYLGNALRRRAKNLKIHITNEHGILTEMVNV